METNNSTSLRKATAGQPGFLGVLLATALKNSKLELRKLLKTAPEFQIIGETEEGKGVLKLAQELLPDLIIIENEIQDSLTICQQIHRTLPQAKVILMTSQDNDDLIFNAIKAGVAGYLVKSQPAADWLDLVRRVSKGEYLINEALLARPEVAHRVLNQFKNLESQFATAKQNLDFSSDLNPFYSPLTGREIEILDWVSKGTSNKQIARQLSISDQTVKNHITSILRKLNANDRTQAVIMAIQHGWVKLDLIKI